jgi:hypothetical protein
VGTHIWLVVSGRPKRSQDTPRELPGTPKDHPEPPDEPLGPPWNVKSLPRTCQVSSRALLTSPKGTPDAKKRPEEHQVCVCPTPGTTTTTKYTHQVRKVRGCAAPLLDKRTGDVITPSGCRSCLFLAGPSCSLFSPYSSNTPVPLDTAVTRSVLNYKIIAGRLNSTSQHICMYILVRLALTLRMVHEGGANKTQLKQQDLVFLI